MSVDVVVLVIAVVFAVVALIAAIVALRAVREARSLREAPPERAESVAVVPTEPIDQRRPIVVDDVDRPEVRVVEGRVIAPPTAEQVVAAQLTRPSARIMILASGLAHALRPESRDRINGLMRRDFRERRRSRQRAARRAARSAPTTTTQMDGWMSS